MSHAEPATAHVGHAVVELHLPAVHSLKEKRGLVRPIVEALRDDLGAGVAEVAWADSWQRAAIGIAVVAGSPTGVDRMLERVVTLCERDPRVVVTSMVEQVDTLTGSDRAR